MKIWKELLILLIFFVLLLISLFGFIVTKNGGIIDDYIIIKNDKFSLMQQQVKDLCGDSLQIGDELLFGISFPKGINGIEDLKKIKNFSNEVEKFFYPESTQSLVNITNYKVIKKGEFEEDVSDFYINKNLFTDKKWKLLDWKKDILKNNNAKDIFIGENFNYALIIVFIKEPYNENELKSKIIEFLEGRAIPSWMNKIFSPAFGSEKIFLDFLKKHNLISWINYFRNDVYPSEKYRDVFVTGWPIARPLMTASLLSSLLTLSLIGIIISAFFAYKALKSYKQTFILLLIIIFGFLIVRGSIGLMQTVTASGLSIFLFFGKPIMERVYIMLAFTSTIIAGNSFALRKLETYNEIKLLCPNLSRKKIWELTKVVNGRMLLILVIASYDFASQYQIGVRGLMEIGFLSVIALLFLFFACIYLLPSLHILIGGETKSGSLEKNKKNYLDKLVNCCYKTINYFPTKKTKKIALLTVLIPFSLVMIMIFSDFIKLTGNFKFISTNTNPLEYIVGTITYKGAKFLNQAQNFGFGISKIVISPIDKDINNPLFIKSVDDFLEEISKFEKVKTVKSITSTIKTIAKVDYNLDFPKNQEQLKDIFDSMSSDLGPAQKPFYWCDKALVIFVSHSGDSSTMQNDLHERIIELSKNKKFATKFKTFLPCKSGTYARGDYYIVTNTPINIITSWIFTFFACFVWIYYVNLSNYDKVSRYTLSPFFASILIIMPFVFSISMITLVMVIFRIPLDQATACINPLSLNAAIDFNIYFIADYHLALINKMNQKQALHYSLKTKGKLILLDVLINAICFLPLVVAPFIPIKRLGLILAVTLLFNGFAALVIMPAMISWAIIPRTKAIGLHKFILSYYQKILNRFLTLKDRQKMISNYYQLSLKGEEK